MSRRPRHGTALLVAAVGAALLAGCAADRQLVAPALDYRAGGGVKVIRIEGFAVEPRRAPSPEGAGPEIVYNLKTEEGRREAERAAARARERDGGGYSESERFTFQVAHQLAMRLAREDVRRELAAVGLAVPVVVASLPRVGDLVATGSPSGSGFERPAEPPPGPTAKVSGEVFFDLDRGEIAEPGALPPVQAGRGRFASAAAFTIAPPGGPPQRHILAYLEKQEAREAGLAKLREDEAEQLVERVVSYCAPHEVAYDETGAPLAFVREVAEDGALVADVGLARRRLSVVRIHGLDGTSARTPFGTIARAELVTAVLQRYVRVRFNGMPPPAGPTGWRVIEVAEER